MQRSFWISYGSFWIMHKRKDSAVMTTTTRKPTTAEPVDELQQFVTTVAGWLNETRDTPRTQIALIVATIGTEKTMALLKDVLAIEERGGLKTVYQKRRRTVGGVFFELAKRRYGQELPDAFWALTFHRRRPKWAVPGAKPKPKKVKKARPRTAQIEQVAAGDASPTTGTDKAS
jgi:hypothetical protein